jgi:hypothetical protein
MLDNIFSFFEKLLLNFTWTRFTFLVTTLLLVLTGAALFEFYTGHFRLARLDREVQILTKAVDLSRKVDQVAAQDPLRIGYNRLAKQISTEIATPPLQIGSFPELPSRVIFGAIPWLALAILVILTTKTGRVSAVAGLVLISVPIVATGVLISDGWDDRISRYVYPWVSMVVTVLLAAFWQKRAAKV